MAKIKEMQIHTVIVDGDASSFKASLSRSILGVTFLKFKRNKSEFYKHQNHNQSVTQSIFNWLYESLLTKIRNISTWKLKTDLTPKWSESGKITSVSDVTVAIYMKVGELRVKDLQVHEEFKNVKIDFFYSETDFASQRLRTVLPDLIKTVGQENFDYNEYEYSTNRGKEMASALGVKGTPTIVLNAERRLENPTEKEICKEIERAFAPMVRPSGKPEFLWDEHAFENAKALCEMQVTINTRVTK